MAGSAKIIDVSRPDTYLYDEATRDFVASPGDSLLVVIDPFSNGGLHHSFMVRMSDWDGLLEEWEAGEGGVVLAAAIGDYAATVVSTDPTFGTGLTADQRVAYIAEVVAYGP